MSSSQVYASLSGTITPEQLCGDVNNGVVSTDWYAPSSFAFDQTSYMTPYPSSTVESQQWNQYARASIPDINMASYLAQAPQLAQQQAFNNTPGRPRSSPSTFGPSPESIAWTSSTGLGIQYTGVASAPTPVTATFPPSVFQYPGEEHYTTSSPPELRQPQPRRPYQSIAPNPAGLAAAAKRRREEEDVAAAESSSSGGKRRKRTSSVASDNMTDDDRFLVQLKETESLPWKDIATRFQTDRGKSFQVAALQMRYKRLREKWRVWEERDVQALRQAHEYWEKYKWEIIGAKMLDFGVTERWPARHCARKWQESEVYPISTTQPMTSGIAQSMSQFSSPVEAPIHFAYSWQPL